MEAVITASLALQGRRAVDLESVVYGCMAPPLCRRSTAARTSRRFIRTARSARNMVEKTIRNMHVPAYSPVELGIQDMEYRGVLVDLKNVMVIWSIPIIAMPDDEIPVELGIDMPPMVIVGEPDMVVDISMFTMACGSVGCSKSEVRR